MKPVHVPTARAGHAHRAQGRWQPIARAALLAALGAGAAVTLATAQTSPGVGAPSASPAQAQTQAQAQPQAGQGHRNLRASQIVGLDVRNPQGQDIGEVTEMMVDMRTGQVLYAILTFDPGIFQAERLFAVPTSQLRMAPDRDNLVFNMQRERLEQAGLSRSDWQQRVQDPSYLATLDRVWGQRGSTPQARLWRVSDLLNKGVQDRRGEQIGKVDELVIDMTRQQVHYAVLAFDQGWTSPEQRFAFPLRAFERQAGHDNLVLDIDRSRVQGMRSFTADRYAHLNDPTWVRDVDTLVMMAAAPAGNTGSGGSGAGNRSGATGGTSGPTSSTSSGAMRSSDADRPRAMRVDRN